MTIGSRSAVHRLFVSRVISLTGGAAAFVALNFTIYERTHSAAWLAAALLVTFGVEGMAAPFAGAIGDRFDRRIVMIVSDLAGAGTTEGVEDFQGGPGAAAGGPGATAQVRQRGRGLAEQDGQHLRHGLGRIGRDTYWSHVQVPHPRRDAAVPALTTDDLVQPGRACGHDRGIVAPRNGQYEVAKHPGRIEPPESESTSVLEGSQALMEALAPKIEVGVRGPSLR